MNTNFLVSCVGAYNDSGLGTGGLVSINKGLASIVDEFDSTALFVHKGFYYRYIRSLKTLIAYDFNGIKSQLYLPEIHDAHDLNVIDNKIVAVSTGSNKILYFDFFGNLLHDLTWHAEGKEDAWHINCIEILNNEVYSTAFGEFKEHRDWHKLGCEKKGFIINTKTQEKVVSGLSGPHHPRFIANKWHVCDSHTSTLQVFENNKKVASIYLGGFTRGFTYDDNFFYVGVNANRKAEISTNQSHITVIDRFDYSIKDKIIVPFPEIYDILITDYKFNENIIASKSNFLLFNNDNLINHLTNQVNLGIEEINKLNKSIESKQKQIDSINKKLPIRIYRKLKKLFSIENLGRNYTIHPNKT